MSMRVISLLTILVVSALNGWAAEPPSIEDLKSRVSKVPEHPRLFMPAGEEKQVRRIVAEDPRMKKVLDAITITAEHMLKEPPVVYRKDGRRLLGRSREALTRTMHLGFAYRLTGDQRFVKRVVAEMEAMAAMPDWNPSHFLDTAEMTLAISVGYDWLYDQLSPDQRKMARDAIENKGLAPYLGAKNRLGWERGGNNWNQVCHAGMVAGALVLAKENPDRAAEVVQRALAGLPYSMKVYDPDGTYPEGPGYWNYGTTFNVMLIDMLESALGSDFGMSKAPGFLGSGEFMLQIIGPTRRTYNFSDCGSGTGFSPAMVWFASRNDRPEWLWHEWVLLDKELRSITESKGRNAGDRYFPLVLTWARPGMQAKEPATLNWLGKGQNPIAVLRSSWSDPNATFVAIKAGTPAASHGHMDIGSFILDAMGERWSLDLGAEDYNKMEQRGIGLWNNKQGSERWKIFRYHNRGHSTLLVNDAEQVLTSKAPVSDFSTDPKNPFAVVDMAETYANELSQASRRFSLGADRSVIIEDALKAGNKPATVRWGMVTPATLKVDGKNAALLTLNGKQLRMEVVSPKGVTIQSWPADPPPNDFDARNPGVSIVGFSTSLKAGEPATLKVALKPNQGK